MLNSSTTRGFIGLGDGKTGNWSRFRDSPQVSSLDSATERRAWQLRSSQARNGRNEGRNACRCLSSCKERRGRSGVDGRSD